MKNQILETFPSFPEEVVDQWLVPFAEDEGWPPVETQGSLTGRWRYLLGTKTNLAFWKKLEWEKEEIELKIELLDDSSKTQISGIITSATMEVENMFSMTMPDLKARFERSLNFISEHRSMPLAPVLVNTDGNYRIMDRNHRIAAYLYCICGMNGMHGVELTTPPIKIQPIWVGRTPIQSR